MRKNEVGLFTPHIKITSKHMEDPNVGDKSIRLFEDNLRVNFHDLGLDSGFFDITPKAQITKEKINWSLSKLKTFTL